jgi:hypothetical protein
MSWWRSTLVTPISFITFDRRCLPNNTDVRGPSGNACDEDPEILVRAGGDESDGTAGSATQHARLFLDATDEAVERGLAFVILGGRAQSRKTPKGGER